MDTNYGRKAIASTTYVEALADKPRLSSAEKKTRLASVIKSANHMQRIGQGLIGPIQIRLRYEGLIRNVLLEDTLERGPLMPYDILDDLGMAYKINQTDAEVKVQMFEGKQAFPELFRIAAFPKVRKEDLYYLRVNAIEFAQDESRQAIQKQEDHYLIQLLEAAIEERGALIDSVPPVGGYATGRATGPSGHTGEKTVLIGANGSIEPTDFYDCAAMIEIEQLEAKTILSNPMEMRDLYTWDTNVTGWKFKDDVVAGGKITKFGEFNFLKSVMVPQGEQFLVADPEFVGVFPVMYSLDVEENHRVEQFHKGWVMDELVGAMVLNSRGLARIVKSDDYAGRTAASSAAHNIQNRGELGG